MTKNAQEFVTPLTFATLSGHPVYTDTFGARGLSAQGDSAWEIDHLSLAEFAEVFPVAPATANVIGKAAGAVADDLLSTALVAARCPVVFAPAMNTDMFENPILQDKIAYLKEKGYRFIEPGEGILACGREGKGRMAEPEEIASFLRELEF
jgi:phosphopantothenoylcysteine decarboxylase/phosphopantothenate--cysteine ligase